MQKPIQKPIQQPRSTGQPGARSLSSSEPAFAAATRNAALLTHQYGTGLWHKDALRPDSVSAGSGGWHEYYQQQDIILHCNLCQGLLTSGPLTLPDLRNKYCG